MTRTVCAVSFICNGITTTVECLWNSCYIAANDNFGMRNATGANVNGIMKYNRMDRCNIVDRFTKKNVRKKTTTTTRANALFACNSFCNVECVLFYFVHLDSFIMISYLAKKCFAQFFKVNKTRNRN